MKNLCKTLLPLALLVALLLPVVTFAQGIIIQSGGFIVANGNAYIVVNNTGFTNYGTFAAGTSTVLFTNTSTISGTTNFNNVTISSGDLTPASSSIMRIAGALTNLGTLQALTNNNTIEYNGTAQTVINPNGGTTGYYNLALSGNGIKTLPASSFQIIGNLSLSESAVTTTTYNLTVGANLNLANTSKLTIAAVKTLTVAGAIANTAGKGGLVLQSDAGGTASLIHNTNSVPARVERYISGSAEDWHFLSAPVSNQIISGDWVPTGTYGNLTGYDLYVWEEPSLCWVYQLNTTVAPNWPTVHPSANFVPGRGYLYSVQAVNTTKSFAGELNNGSVLYGLSADDSTDLNLQGFNLIGNPYPSSIDWMASKGWIRDNLVNSGGGNDMWIWNPDAENYGVYNSADASGVGTNAVTRYIPTMQGFFVRAQTAGNLETTNDVRVHDATTLWKSARLEPNRFIAVVNSESDQTFDEVRLLFGYPENKAGAAKLFSPVATAPSLYLTEGEANFTIRYLSDTVENPHVPLLFKAGRDSYYIMNFDFDNFDFDIAVLEDRLTGEFTDLTLAPEYRFSASKSDNENRFFIHFGAIPANENMELPANIYTTGGDLVIDLTLVDDRTEVKVVDVLGRTLLQKDLNGNSVHKLDINITSQVVIVYAKTNKAMLSRKVLVH